jgi:hypothetical protein
MMVAGGLMAIACFISPNASPSSWMIGGRSQDVTAIETTAQASGSIRRTAGAKDGETAFAIFEFDAVTPYREIGGIMFDAQRRKLLVSVPTPGIPSCTDGSAEDVGDSHAPDVIVGIFGEARPIEAMMADLPWAKTVATRLPDGQQGISFKPSPEQAILYGSFVEKAASGGFPDVRIVLLKPAEK